MPAFDVARRVEGPVVPDRSDEDDEDAAAALRGLPPG